MNTSGTRRVVLGVDNSLAGLRALRIAVAEARRGGILYAVRVWSRPPAASGPLVPPLVFGDYLADAARDYVRCAFDDAMGGMPADLPIIITTPQGAPGPTLVRLAARDTDLLVVGIGGHGRMHRMVTGSVSHYCFEHARCPLLAVPPHALAREVGRHRLLGRRRWSDLSAPTGAPRPPARKVTDAAAEEITDWPHRPWR
jgi:nucleotide-binding universal stress UspA family protein